MSRSQAPYLSYILLWLKIYIQSKIYFYHSRTAKSIIHLSHLLGIFKYICVFVSPHKTDTQQWLYRQVNQKDFRGHNLSWEFCVSPEKLDHTSANAKRRARRGFARRVAGAHSAINCCKRNTTLELLPDMVKKEMTFTVNLEKVFAGAVCLIHAVYRLLSSLSEQCAMHPGKQPSGKAAAWDSPWTRAGPQFGLPGLPWWLLRRGRESQPCIRPSSAGWFSSHGRKSWTGCASVH